MPVQEDPFFPTPVEPYTPPAASQPVNEPTPTDIVTTIEAEMDRTKDKYSTWSGGPNAAIIKSLNQGIQNKSQQYKKNAADVENMYGELTMEADTSAARVLGQYEAAIGKTGERASALQNVMSNELGNQQARRAALAAELGISPENALTSYSSDNRFNEAMNRVLGEGQSWQGLLEAQKLSSQDQAANMRTAIGNTKSATKVGLAEARDAAINQYRSAIMEEQSKRATQNLTPAGQIRMSVLGKKYEAALDGGQELAKWQQDEQSKFDQFGAQVLGVKPGEVMPDYTEGSPFAEYVARAATYLASDEYRSGGKPDPLLAKFMSIFKDELRNVNPNYADYNPLGGINTIGSPN
jgi:hypothetical protein